jgi:retinol dehydrogenase 12
MDKRVKANGKVALVTGGCCGVGALAARKLALSGYHVFLACKDSVRTQELINSIVEDCAGNAQIEFLELDLGDFLSVRRAANCLNARGLALDLLLANEDVDDMKGTTSSGFEVAFGVCHMGHFLLWKLLMPALKQARQARVIVVSSSAHRYARQIRFDAFDQPATSMAGLKEYAAAKLCNILFTRQLALRLRCSGVTAYCIHPGLFTKRLWTCLPTILQFLIRPFVLTHEQVVQGILHCATADLQYLQSGGYYVNGLLAEPSALACDENLAAQLWEYSERRIARVQSMLT